MGTGVDIFGTKGLDPEDAQRLRTQQLMGLAASLLQAGAPSTDPRSGSLAYALGQGLQGMAGARQQGLAGMMARQRAEREQAEAERQEQLRTALGQVPTTVPGAPVEMQEPVGPGLAGQLGVADLPTPDLTTVQPRGLSEMFGDYARVYAEQGYPMEAAKLVKAAMPETETGELPRFHVGFEQTWPRPEGVSPTYWKNRRGTAEYQNNLQKYLGMTGGGQYARDAEGNIIRMPSRGGTIETVTREPAGGLRPVTRKSIPSEKVTQLASIRTTHGRLQDVKERATKMMDKIGPIEGRWAQVRNKFISDGDTEYMLREVESMITLAYALSGKQISEKEMRLLRAAILPQVFQPDMNFMAALEHAMDWLSDNYQANVEEFSNQGYIVPKEMKTFKKKEKTSKYKILSVE